MGEELYDGREMAAWSLLVLQREPYAAEHLRDAESMRVHGDKEYLELRELIRPLATITVGDKVYKCQSSMITKSNWKLIADRLYQASTYKYTNIATSMYFLLEMATKVVDSEIKKIKQRRNYIHIFESLIYRCAYEGSLDCLMAYNSMRAWVYSSYYHGLESRTILDCLEWFAQHGFWSYTVGTRWDKDTCTRVRVYPEPFGSATVESTATWIDHHENSYEGMRIREASAHDDKLPREIETYVDKNGRRKVRLGGPTCFQI